MIPGNPTGGRREFDYKEGEQTCRRTSKDSILYRSDSLQQTVFIVLVVFYESWMSSPVVMDHQSCTFDTSCFYKD